MEGVAALDRNGREPEPAIARLVGKRFVTGSEMQPTKLVHYRLVGHKIL